LEHTILELRDSATVLSQLGLVLDPLESSMVLELTRADSATPEQVLAIDIASASFPVQLPSGTTIGDSAPERSTATTADDLPEAGGATGLYVRLFGTPRVEGSTGELRERHVECIAFLALRGPTDSDRVKTALWPARMPSDSRWSSFLSELRGALGATAEGELVFPHLRSKGLRLNGSVDTDIDEFTRIYTQVRDGKGPAIERATTMLAALGLVAGQPFQSRRGYEWAFSDGTVACIERIIGEACHLTVDLALEARELEIASHAIERGLNALPGSELLYRDRMRVAHARGDRAEIDRAFKELADILEAEDMECAPHPETVALRDELMTSQLERI
jgi:DNA-binding SARP family transcriptional activator